MARRNNWTLLPSLLLGLAACGDLEQAGPGMGGKGDSLTDDPEVVFSCQQDSCAAQCASTLEQLVVSARTCARAPHEGPGCTIVCYDDKKTAPPAPGSNYGTVCETPRGECGGAWGPINGGCFCGTTPGRITR